MSKGFGTVQRDILAKLTDRTGEHVVTRWLNADEIRQHMRQLISGESLTNFEAIPDEEILRNRYSLRWARVTARYTLMADVCGDEASPARIESYRRAAHTLAAAGLVDTCLVFVQHRHELAVRLTDQKV